MYYLFRRHRRPGPALPGKAGIYTVRRVKKSDMDKLARATGARVVTSIHEISKDDLGKAVSLKRGR